MIEYAYRQSGGDVSVVNQCEAALEELSALVNAAQQGVQADASSVLRQEVVIEKDGTRSYRGVRKTKRR